MNCYFVFSFEFFVANRAFERTFLTVRQEVLFQSNFFVESFGALRTAEGIVGLIFFKFYFAYSACIFVIPPENKVLY